MSPYFSVSAARTDTRNRNCSLILLTSCPGSASEHDLWAAVVTQWEMTLREECVLWLVGSAWGVGVESNPAMQVINMVGEGLQHDR